jgi:hypothetical protein
MTVQELIAELNKLPPALPVFVAESPGHDHVPLEMVLPTEDVHDDYVLLAGDFSD